MHEALAVTQLRSIRCFKHIYHYCYFSRISSETDARTSCHQLPVPIIIVWSANQCVASKFFSSDLITDASSLCPVATKSAQYQNLASATQQTHHQISLAMSAFPPPSTTAIDWANVGFKIREGEFSKAPSIALCCDISMPYPDRSQTELS